MEIIRGVIPCAKKVVVYGPEGIGKSTFASKFPDPVFIDTEGSTSAMDVARLPKATSWQMLLEQVDYIRMHPEACKTLVVDTIDWAEQMCVESICAKHHKSGIEDFGYGNGYVYTKEEFGRFLNKLSELVGAGINVVLTAHAQIRKFEQPDELGAYDRWELKLGKKTSSQTSPLVKEWADMLLFANYKTYSVATDDKGKKHKAQGGTRVMYTAHHPCWDAKNRYGLPEEVPFEYASIAHIIGSAAQPQPERQAPYNEHTPPKIADRDMYFLHPESDSVWTVKKGDVLEHAAEGLVEEISREDYEKILTRKNKPDAAQKESQQMSLPLDQPDPVPDVGGPFPAQDPQIPKPLRDLMEVNHVDEWELQNVVAARGYYPSDVPIRDYDAEFINGCLIGAWDQVHGLVKEMRKKQEIPFNN